MGDADAVSLISTAWASRRHKVATKEHPRHDAWPRRGGGEKDMLTYSKYYHLDSGFYGRWDELFFGVRCCCSRCGVQVLSCQWDT